MGGAGWMGSTAARTAAAFPEFAEIVIADRNRGEAERVADHIGPKARAVAFDADRDDPGELLDGCWGVLSTLGPFTRFGTRILAAAIEAGCRYVDINDDWEPTLDALELDARARDRGVTALIGMGASPGVTNLLAVRAGRELDETEELMTGWALAGTSPEVPGSGPSAAMLHFVHQCTGTIPVVENGDWRDVSPFQVVSLDYPGIGEIRTRTIGHPEVVTLPRAFPGLRRCANLMSGPEWYFERVHEVLARVEARTLTDTEAAVQLDQPQARPADAPPTVRTPTLWAWASGVRDGRPTTVGAGLTRWPAGKMAGSTGIPAAIGLRLLARGDITATGVVTPETAVPADAFFAEFDPFCTQPDGTDGALVSVTRGEVTAMPQGSR
ncbi:saccharopine dehydrogenase family protein [Pseudonocardia sp. C8]|uniref:saccharopine dehydrogenase family protein n=1 Tax=Pseudonocardia sp. C8 TaxID=2762759 RepID=UPI00351C0025